MFGGESNSRFSYEAIWSYNIAENNWTRFETDNHPVRAGGMTAAYDSESDKVIYLFQSHLDSFAPMGLSLFSETWAFDVTSGSWTNMNPEPAPFGLQGNNMVYDSESDRIILFGGADFTKGLSNADWFNPTWAYDFNSNTWSELAPEVVPPARATYAMTYDSAADRVLIFAGLPEEAAAGLWAFDYNTLTWEEIDYTGDVLPDHHPSMVYESARGHTLYMTGDTFSEFDYATSSWAFASRDSDLGIRYRHAMVYDEASQKMFVFGGGPRGLRYDNELWAYDTEAGTWEKMGPN